jgi:hypothetical protein
VILIVFYLCLRSWIAALIFLSSWSHYWTCSSSYSVVESCVSLSNNTVVVRTCFSISVSWSAASTFLFFRTSDEVMGLRLFLSSSISFLYWSILCAMRCIFSSMLLYVTCALSRIQLYVIVNLCSNLSARSFSSSFFAVNWLHDIWSNSATPLPTSRFVAPMRALDCTSYMMLDCSPYKSFVRMCSITTSSCSTNCRGFCIVSLSILII